MIKLIYISILLSLAPIFGFSQTREKIDLNDGVANYERGKFKDAQSSFERAYAENPNYTRALYNAGNSAYLAGHFDTAMIYYSDYANKVKSKKEVAKAYFNIGNANLQKAAKAESSQESAKNAQAFYKEAISAYKESLKNNPNDIETKYNLTYALDKLQKNQEQQKKDDQNKDKQDKGDEGDKGEKGDKGENGDEKDDGDKGEEQENKEGDKGDKKEGDQKGDEEGDDNEDKQDDPDGKPEDEEKEGDKEEGQGQNDKGDEQQEEQPVEGQISKAQAIKDLDAINADEGKILQKVYQKKGDKKVKKSSDKDW